MKKYLLILFAPLLLSCGNNENESNIENDTFKDSQNIKIDSVEIEEDISGSELLLKITESKKGLNDSMKLYLSLISEEITHEEQIIKAFEIRKKILMKTEQAVFDYLANLQTDYDDELEKELNKAGFQGIYAEGMFMVLGVAPVLEKEIERFASEEFKLKINFKNAVASSLGSEYPFDTMTDEMEVVKIGEEIMKRFPNSKLSKEIKEEFMRNVSCFTDFHVVTHSNGSEPDYIVGGLDVSVYPGGSSKGNFEAFIKKLPKSKYTPVIKKILENPSVISAKEETGVFLVVVQILDDYFDADKIIFNYINQGIDIPHHIIIREGDEAKSAVVYRFFTDFNKAEEALAEIQKEFPEAQIIKVDTGGNIQ